MNKKLEYVVGFAFDKEHEVVVLIWKEKPAWQKGRLNGVGGKVEPGESLNRAMSREFYEETDVATEDNDWTRKFTIEDPDCLIHFFKANLPYRKLSKIRQVEIERPVVFPVDLVPWNKALPNVRWAIPFMKLEYANTFLLINELDPSVHYVEH